MVHLLVRVACPVVRLFFNNEIKPDQLRKTLDKKKPEIVKQYRKKDTIINDSQWNLLFGPDIGEYFRVIKSLFRLYDVMCNLVFDKFSYAQNTIYT